MFIKGLSKELQSAFLNLAYTMVYADNQLAEEEKKIFDSYSLEVDVDMKDAHKVDFAQELAVFDKCNDVIKRRVFFELYAIALIDDVYAEEEKLLVDMMKERFNISDAKMEEMRNGLNNLTNAYKKLEDIVKQ